MCAENKKWGWNCEQRFTTKEYHKDLCHLIPFSWLKIKRFNHTHPKTRHNKFSNNFYENVRIECRGMNCKSQKGQAMDATKIPLICAMRIAWRMYTFMTWLANQFATVKIMTLKGLMGRGHQDILEDPGPGHPAGHGNAKHPYSKMLLEPGWRLKAL